VTQAYSTASLIW